MRRLSPRSFAGRRREERVRSSSLYAIKYCQSRQPNIRERERIDGSEPSPPSQASASLSVIIPLHLISSLSSLPVPLACQELLHPSSLLFQIEWAARGRCRGWNQLPRAIPSSSSFFDLLFSFYYF